MASSVMTNPSLILIVKTQSPCSPSASSASVFQSLWCVSLKLHISSCTSRCTLTGCGFQASQNEQMRGDPGFVKGGNFKSCSKTNFRWSFGSHLYALKERKQETEERQHSTSVANHSNAGCGCGRRGWGRDGAFP